MKKICIKIPVRKLKMFKSLLKDRNIRMDGIDGQHKVYELVIPVGEIQRTHTGWVFDSNTGTCTFEGERKLLDVGMKILESIHRTKSGYSCPDPQSTRKACADGWGYYVCYFASEGEVIERLNQCFDKEHPENHFNINTVVLNRRVNSRIPAFYKAVDAYDQKTKEIFAMVDKVHVSATVLVMSLNNKGMALRKEAVDRTASFMDGLSSEFILPTFDENLILRLRAIKVLTEILNLKSNKTT